MSGFTVDWLTLREPADERARDKGLLDQLERWFAGCERLAITDLGCGTGATMRALAGRLAHAQSWRLVDHDQRLLAAIRPPAAAGSTVEWEALQSDLRAEVERIVALPADLVSMSALLDLVSRDWLQRLADALAANRRPLYAALNYDGRMSCDPLHPLDTDMLTAFNAHQRTDKGFGAALGPAAASAMADAMRVHGYDVHLGPSDWIVRPDESDLQRVLVTGWAEAAQEMGTLDDADVTIWREHRLAAIGQGSLAITVGHVDLWAHPPAR